MGRPGVDRAGGGGACNVLGAGSIGGAPLQEAGARPDPAAVAVADRDAPAGKRPRPMALAVWVWPCGGRQRSAAQYNDTAAAGRHPAGVACHTNPS